MIRVGVLTRVGSTRGTKNHPFVWVLDPVNGIEERLLPRFGMSIAVVHNGKSVIGCISNPITGIKTVGMRGKTTRNGALV
ncbi:hypothetical protein RND71_010840 [Anisodus tanguticus]|uniref:Uncharacterized protein n=1 Tax=Anisodus tanguticus TaxID=243964 RepID=A0AAE1VT10_9SOLA|nr:hypothetical protein RND71_010840 [Anisodus tanguticus]